MKANLKIVALLCVLVASACKKNQLVQEPEQSLSFNSKVKSKPSGIVTAVYYVDNTGGNDSNDGLSAATAWKTLAKVNSTTFVAGNQILFKTGGSWTGQLHPLGSGSAGSPIVIGKYGSGKRPVIKGGGVTTGAVYLSNQEHWEITNLEITNFNSTEAGGITLSAWEANNTTNYANATLPAKEVNANAMKYGVYVYATNIGAVHHIYLHNLNVHGVNGLVDENINTVNNGGIGFRISGSATATWFDDVLVDSCTVHDVDRMGMFFVSSWNTRTLTNNGNWTPSSNIIVRGNTFTNTGGNALIVRVANSPLIEYNLFDHSSIKTTGNACFTFNTDNAIMQFNESRYTKANVDDFDAGGIDSDFMCKNTIIQYNYLHDNDYGILITGGHEADDFNDGTQFRYNILEREGSVPQTGSSGKFIFKISGGATNTTIYNNTVDVGSNQTGLKVIYHVLWGTRLAANSRYYNNIVAYYGTGATYSLGMSTGNVFDYNDFYNMTTRPSQAHAFTSNPNLTNPDVGDVNGYKLLSSSTIIGQGTVILGNGGRDYYGNSVSSTLSPNIGCYNGAGL